jgi:hypothetical protein
VLITARSFCCHCHYLFEVLLVNKMMSSAELGEAEAVKNVCGWCGIAEVDNVKLEDCHGCDLVKYCSDNCRGEHRHWHIPECKIRKAELHDKELFTQPNGSHLGECPICFLPLSLDAKKSAFYPCCSASICDGCSYTHASNGGDRCPFCRELEPGGDEERRERMMERVKANDPAALSEMGIIKRHTEGDYDGAFEYLTKAAEMGEMRSHYLLGVMYMRGEGVEKDVEKAVYHLEKAAIGGHPWARYNIGAYEWNSGMHQRAVKHFIIAANVGHEDSMKALWKHYSQGNITKEDLEVTLRTHKAAIDATKSSQREEAEACRKRGSPLG